MDSTQRQVVSRGCRSQYVPGTWNQIILANVRLEYMICDQYFRPSLYLSKLEVVLYEIMKPTMVPMLQVAR